MNSLFFIEENNKYWRWVYLSMQAILISVGLYWSRNLSSSIPSIEWMGIYSLEYFKGWSLLEVSQFLLSNKIGIPPVIGFIEIASNNFLGSPEIVTRYLYLISLIGCYVLALRFSATSLPRMIICFLTSLVFIYSSIKIHPGNAQGYDFYFPFFLMLSLLFLFQLKYFQGKSQVTQLLISFLCGFFLSMAELSRPFVIYSLPILLGFYLYQIRRIYKRAPQVCLIFLLPILIFSVGWHTHLLLRHSQITFTNHAGFNMSRAWLDAEYPKLIPERVVIINGIEKQNLNTDIHQLNSELLKKAVLKYWVQHPVDSFINFSERVNVLLSGPTNIYQHAPSSAIFIFYKRLVAISSGIVLLSFLTFIPAFFFLKKRYQADLHVDNYLVALIFFCCVIFSLGERGEEARFLLSILPMLAVLPIIRMKGLPKSVEVTNLANW